MKYQTFDGNDPIRVFEFLNLFVNEADTLDMSKAQDLVDLPTLLTNPVETQFRTKLCGGSRHGGVTCWTETIQNFMRAYATTTAIRETLDNNRSICQRDDGLEEEYGRCFKEAICRCGNVQEHEEKMNTRIDGLYKTIQTIVARHRESTPRVELKVEELVHFSRYKDDVVCARTRQNCQ